MPTFCLRVLLLVLLLSVVACSTPQAIKPDPRLPAAMPWDLAALSKAPEFEWVDSTGPVRSLTYGGLEYQGKSTSVFAYYATPGTLAGDPSKDKNLPAVVLIHGGGGTAFRQWVELWAKRGYAAIAMDLGGARPNEGQNPHDRKNRTRLPNGGPNQDDAAKFHSIDSPKAEHWPYHAVANAILAHSLVRSFPEVDADRTAVTGISWGGYLTCIVASLDNRFKAAVPVYGCGFLHENSAWLNIFDKMTPSQRDKWVELYDPSRYLPACRVPIFFVNGTNDFAYPLDSYMKSYRAVPQETPKNIRVTVNMPHSHPAGWEPKEIGMFVDQELNGGGRWPQVHVSESGSLSGYAGYGIIRIAIHSTVDSANPINKRSWQSKDVFISPNPVILEPWAGITAVPPKEAAAWFVIITDDRGATVSSEVVIVK